MGSTVKTDLGFTISADMKVSEQCVLQLQKVMQFLC